MMQAASTYAAEEGLGRLALAADVVAMLADEQIKGDGVDGLVCPQAGLGEMVEGDEVGLRGVLGAEADAPAGQLLEGGDTRVVADDDDGGQVTVGVAHADGFGGAAQLFSGGPGLEPGEGRVPGDVDVASEVGLHLALVVGVEDVIEVEAPRHKVFAEALPDGDHLGVVGHSAHEKRSVLAH